MSNARIPGRDPRFAGHALAVLIFAIVAALGGCTSGQGAGTAPSEPAGSVDPGSASSTPIAVPRASTASVPTVESTEPAELHPATLRTIAAANELGSQLTLGREIFAGAEYTSRRASYVSDGLTISGILLQPRAPGRHPGVVLVHGFVDPADYSTGGALPREQAYLARAGYVVFYTDLRGLGGSDPGPSEVPDLEMGATEDVINAVNALATSDLPSLDSKRIVLMGHSLGGLLVLNVLVAKPGLVDAAAAFAPSGTDRWEDVGLYLTPGDPIYQAIIGAHGTPATNPTYWADVSPRTFVDRVSEPLLIVQGDVDLDVPIAGTKATVDIWTKAGKDVTFVTLKGEAHEFDARWGKAMAAVTTFFAKQGD